MNFIIVVCLEWNAIVYAIRRAVIIISTALISVDYTKCDIISMDNGVKDYLQRLKDTGKNHALRSVNNFIDFFFLHIFVFKWHLKKEKKNKQTVLSIRIRGSEAHIVFAAPRIL